MTDPNFYIETPRLYISYFIAENPKHCAFLVELCNSSLFISSVGQTGVTDKVQARDRTRNRFVPERKRNIYEGYLVSLKPIPNESFTDSQLIGAVSLMKRVPKESRSYSAPDIGYSIIPKMNAKGYATKSTKALLDYAKTELDITEVLRFFDPKNVGSRKVMEKIGLEVRGIKALQAFGGVEGALYAFPGMKDLKEYGIE